MSPSGAWRDLLAAASRELSAAGIDGAVRDARLLLAHTLGIDTAQLIAIEQDPVTDPGAASFTALVARRAAGEPVSRIRGWRQFYRHRFIVTPDVLDPRPETELLVEAALARLPPRGRILDLGAGSGCILVSILAARPDATGIGLDLSPAALAVARQNAGALGVSDRASWIEGGWEAARALAPVDVIVSNPPYIPARDIPALDRDVRLHDPHLALVGGEDGLAPYRAIIPLAREILTPGGLLAMEVGVGQAGEVSAMLADTGLAPGDPIWDISGIERVVQAFQPSTQGGA